MVKFRPSLVLPLVLLGLVAIACASPPGGIYYASGKGAVTPDGLHRVDWEPFRVTYVKPGADLQRYAKILVQDVTVSYKTPPRRSSLQLDAIDPNFALPDSSLQSMKRYFHDIFVKQLGESQNFTVVSEPGPDVLLISGHIVNLQITVPPEADVDPDQQTYTRSSGQMTLLLDARDSQSGEPLVRVGEARAIDLAGGGWYESDPVANSGAVRDAFRTWASDLRRELDEFHALPALPPVATPPPEN
jgi:hypothetical protein